MYTIKDFWTKCYVACAVHTHNFTEDQSAQNLFKVKYSSDKYIAMSRNAYMKLDEIKKLDHPILDSSDVFCVQED